MEIEKELEKFARYVHELSNWNFYDWSDKGKFNPKTAPLDMGIKNTIKSLAERLK